MTLALSSASAFRFSSLRAFFSRVSLAARRARAANATYRELSRLPDRTLKDIGISRAGILDAAREAGFRIR